MFFYFFRSKKWSLRWTFFFTGLIRKPAVHRHRQCRRWPTSSTLWPCTTVAIIHTSRLHILVSTTTLHSHQEIDANVSPSLGLRRPQNSGDPREPSHPLPSPHLWVTQRRPSCHHVSPWCGVCKRRKSSWSHSVRPAPHRRHAEHGARANFRPPWMPKRQCCTKEAEALRESGNDDLFLQRDWIKSTSPIPAGHNEILFSAHCLSETQLARIVSSNKRWQTNLLLLVAFCCPYSRPVFSTATVWSLWAASGPCSVHILPRMAVGCRLGVWLLRAYAAYLRLHLHKTRPNGEVGLGWNSFFGLS